MWYLSNLLCKSGVFSFPHRSPGSGLYDNLQQYDLPYAEAIFEIGFFHQNPHPFFALAKELYPGNYQPNLTHHFVRLLQKKGQLLRMYTQNIDGLERCMYLGIHCTWSILSPSSRSLNCVCVSSGRDSS